MDRELLTGKDVLNAWNDGGGFRTLEKLIDEAIHQAIMRGKDNILESQD